MTTSGENLIFTVLLISVFFFFDITNAVAAGETTAGTMTATAGHQSLSITAPYVEDGIGNNSLLIEWGISGEDFALGLQSLPNTPSPYTYTIAGLDNGTAYQVRVTWQDVDNIPDNPTQTLTNLIPCNSLIHSSLSTGSAKWNGSWGVSGGQYGEFTCQTCHQRNSGNIKRVKKNLAVTDPLQRTLGIVFRLNET